MNYLLLFIKKRSYFVLSNFLKVVDWFVLFALASSTISYISISFSSARWIQTENDLFKSALDIFIFASIHTSYKVVFKVCAQQWRDSLRLACCIISSWEKFNENSFASDCSITVFFSYLITDVHSSNHILNEFYAIIDAIRLQFMMHTLKRCHIFIITARCSSWLQ